MKEYLQIQLKQKPDGSSALRAATNDIDVENRISSKVNESIMLQGAMALLQRMGTSPRLNDVQHKRTDGKWPLQTLYSKTYLRGPTRWRSWESFPRSSGPI